MREIEELEIVYKHCLNNEDKNNYVHETMHISKKGGVDLVSKFDGFDFKPLTYHHHINNREFEQIIEITNDFLSRKSINKPEKSVHEYEINIHYSDNTRKFFRNSLEEEQDITFMNFRNQFCHILNIPSDLMNIDD